MNWMLMPYRRYFDFAGRSRRMEYWMFVLFSVLVYVVLGAMFGHNTEVVRGPTNFYVNRALTGPGNAIAGLFWLGSLIPALAVAVRRLHDQDRTGWLLLLWFIPFFGWFALFVLMLLDGTPGDNRYGPDPKGRGTVDVFR